jgi:resuscitation-promoting factor RpfA
MTRRWRLLAWTAVLALGLRALHALGTGTLAVPLTSAEDLSAWVDRTPPDVMAAAIVRLLALVAAWYLAACTLAVALVRPFGGTRVASVAARATPAVVRRIVSGGSGLGLAAGTLIGALPTADVATTGLAPAPAAASVVVGVQNPAPPTATMTRNPEDVPTAVMTRLPAEEAPPPSRAPPAAPSHSPEPAPAAAPSSWTVEAGDSFWSIAAETVAPAADAPDDRRVIGYWRRLVDANRSRLLDPGNPDLLVPDQELLLPPPGDAERGTEGSGVGRRRG